MPWFDHSAAARAWPRAEMEMPAETLAETLTEPLTLGAPGPEIARLPPRERGAERAARLARLRAALPAEAAAAGAPCLIDRAAAEPARAPAQTPERTPEAGLDRLDGVGPGLAWALGRAGIGDLATLAALDPAALAERLGPIGRLVPAEAWIARARARA